MFGVTEMWVICPDYYTEGLSEPVAAFAIEAEAHAAVELLKSGHQSFRLCRVPVWPHLEKDGEQRARLAILAGAKS